MSQLRPRPMTMARQLPKAYDQSLMRLWQGRGTGAPQILRLHLANHELETHQRVGDEVLIEYRRHKDVDRPRHDPLHRLAHVVAVRLVEQRHAAADRLTQQVPVLALLPGRAYQRACIEMAAVGLAGFQTQLRLASSPAGLPPSEALAAL